MAVLLIPCFTFDVHAHVCIYSHVIDSIFGLRYFSECSCSAQLKGTSTTHQRYICKLQATRCNLSYIHVCACANRATACSKLKQNLCTGIMYIFREFCSRALQNKCGSSMRFPSSLLPISLPYLPPCLSHLLLSLL